MTLPDEYRCCECDGRGTVECDMGHEHECQECMGRRYDPAVIDSMRFAVAESEMLKGGSTWALVEGGEEVGRTNGKESIRYEDFKKDVR